MAFSKEATRAENDHVAFVLFYQPLQSFSPKVSQAYLKKLKQTFKGK